MKLRYTFSVLVLGSLGCAGFLSAEEGPSINSPSSHDHDAECRDDHAIASSETEIHSEVPT